MGEPKALLRISAETFLDRLVRVFESCDIEVIVVLGADAERVQRESAGARSSRIVVNPNPERGQLSSLQCGLRAVAESTEGIFFTPVDSPGVATATVEQLQKSIGETFVIPRHGGKHGHPIGFRSRLAREFLDLDPARDTARDVVHRHQSTTVYVDVEDAAIHWDIDDPEQYARFIAGTTAGAKP